MKTRAPAAEDPLLLTVPQAVARLGLPRTRVYMAIMRGELFSVRVGKSRRIPAHALETYVSRLCAEQADPRE